jgi:predicted nucleic acid-binding protein
MKVFLDTSSLFKLYHYESGTDELDSFFESTKIDQIYLSEIAKIEFNSAIWKKVRQKLLSSENAEILISCFTDDYSKFVFIDLSNELANVAKDLVVKYGNKGLRTLDSIQLASAISVKSDIKLAITSDDLLSAIMTLEEIGIK